ncbi:MAG: iron-containing alcohol dehydrogenase family protein [Lachnospiraceae bacterium]|nr:iron-containing alcohol dehydrogenase family protein [Lachnospiraceae bacterium]
MKPYSVYFANYTIGTEVYDQVPEVCSLYGKRILLIGGEKAYAAAKEKLEDAVADSNLTIVDAVLYGEDCTPSTIAKWAGYARECQADMIFGMGGGKALDTAKGAADRAGLPVFTFPTIAATCAATTALSVVYREDGAFDSFYFYDRPARHCFIDLQVLADAPVRYLRAGMGDTMGKFFECHFSARGDKLDHSSWMGREISNLCYEPLLEHGIQALKDCQQHRVSEDLQQAVLANIVSTGMVSLMVVDDYNCAIAHSVYYGLVLLPGFEEQYLHGDVVAYGVLVQLAVDKDREEMLRVRNFMQELGIPTSLKQMQLQLDREALKQVLHEIVTGPDMEHIPYEVTEDMIYHAMEEVEALDT